MLLQEVIQEEKYNTRTIKILEAAGYETEESLAELIPRKYTDYRAIKKIQECENGKHAAVKALLLTADQRTSSANRKYLYCRFRQDDGYVFSSFSFSNTHLFDYYKMLVNQYVVVCGKVSLDPTYGMTISLDEFRLASDFKPHITSTYRKFKGISDEMLLKMINRSVSKAQDILPEALREKWGIPEYKKALYGLHHPVNEQDIRIGRSRIILNDMLYLTLSLMQKQIEDESPIIKGANAANRLVQLLPFKMTGDQIRSIQAFLNLTKEGKRADALLQGDVGCGKTIVAAALMLAAADNGFQAVLAAPRSVLARQHYEEISRYAEMMDMKCVFLHSGMKKKEEDIILSQIETGEANLIIGTHSCFSDKVFYKNLALVVIDEEHLFGAEQKTAIESSALKGYHKLSMSATPIPRTLTDILFAESNKLLLNIKEKPKGRLPIKTKIIKKREEIFSLMEKEIAEGHKCYVVCPAIDSEGMDNVEETGNIYKSHFEKLGIQSESLNGRCSEKEINKIMERFHSGETSILISTTVIEVGVNDPNATVMVIEGADRFGLATLHQLRGRVGRSSLQSYCLLRSEEEENERLKAIEKTEDGFEIAQMDIDIRGTGNILGLEQSGYNKLIDEALKYPSIFIKAKKISNELTQYV